MTRIWLSITKTRYRNFRCWVEINYDFPMTVIIILHACSCIVLVELILLQYSTVLNGHLVTIVTTVAYESRAILIHKSFWQYSFLMCELKSYPSGGARQNRTEFRRSDRYVIGSTWVFNKSTKVPPPKLNNVKDRFKEWVKQRIVQVKFNITQVELMKSIVICNNLWILLLKK